MSTDAKNSKVVELFGSQPHSSGEAEKAKAIVELVARSGQEVATDRADLVPNVHNPNEELATDSLRSATPNPVSAEVTPESIDQIPSPLQVIQAAAIVADTVRGWLDEVA